MPHDDKRAFARRLPFADEDYMELKRILGILRDLFLPQPRNACPHCGGIRCIGACQFNEKQPVAAEDRAAPAVAPAVAPAEPPAAPAGQAASLPSEQAKTGHK